MESKIKLIVGEKLLHTNRKCDPATLPERAQLIKTKMEIKKECCISKQNVSSIKKDSRWIELGILALPNIERMYKTKAFEIWAFFFLFLHTTTAILDVSDNKGLNTFDDLGSAFIALSDISHKQETKDSFYLDEGEIFYISDFSIGEDMGLRKRWNTTSLPFGATWTRSRVVDQGTTWGEWSAISCPEENNQEFALPVLVNSTWEYSATWGAGFKFDLAQRKALRSGYSITKEVKDAGSGVYVVPGKDYGQLFRRQLLLWQTQQQQKCTKKHRDTDGFICSEWGKNISGYMPVTNGQRFGWRIGLENMNFKNCVGDFSRKMN